MSLKTNDIKRLKKNELIQLAVKSSINICNSHRTKKTVDSSVVSAGICDTLASQPACVDNAETLDIPVALDCDVLHYLTTADDLLVWVPL